MKTYIIKSDYEKEIKADSPEEALEKWRENVEQDLASSNTTIANEFFESLEAKEIKCDNVDCKSKDPRDIQEVVLTEDFDNEHCYWCKECRERDKDMIMEDINDAQHPIRQKAIKILESISEKMGNENMFDGEKWYELEDLITNIIEE